MTSNQKNSSRLDYGLVLILFLLFLASCIAIYSAQGQYVGNFLFKQIFWYVVGTVIIATVIRFDSDQLMKISWYVYGLGLSLLGFLIVAPASIAPRINGSKNWFKLPGGLGTIQPSEFVKVFLILALAKVIVDHHQNNQNKTTQTDLWLLVKIGLVTAAPLILVIKEDLGTSLVFIAIMGGMVFISGITWRLLLPILGSSSLFVYGIFYLVLSKPELLEKTLGVEQYQFNRIYSWLDPYNYQSTSGFQLTKSLLAIGSGETLGKGYGNREVNLPEAQTDFIFSVVGEQFGFIGASILISLFFLLIYQITKVGMETKNDFYTFVCVGVISMITFHVFQNIGMTIGLLPITGIPLPFVSYGGSSLMGNMLAVGLIFSIRYHYKKYMFSTND
jgi:rod shape determining protein RodA